MLLPPPAATTTRLSPRCSRSAPSAATALADCVPLTRSAGANASAFFVYSPLSAATVNFTLTVLAGAPSLYVSSTAAAPGPGSGAWQWSAVQGPAGGAGVLFVSL
jgi:hypothetical protein